MTQIATFSAPKTLSEAETSRYIGLSRSFLAKSRMEGQRGNRTPAPPFIKIGHRVRYAKDDLDAWVKEQPRYQHIGEIA